MAFLVLSVAATAADLPAECKKRSFNIPRQDMAEALIQLARQARLTFFVSMDTVSGRTANEVIGHLTARQAVVTLLEGTGLHGQFRNGNVLSITRITPGDSPEPADEVCEMGNKKGAVFSLANLAAAIAATLSAPVDAQTIDRETPRIIEEVIVTAQKRAESVNDVPIAITALNRSLLQAANVGSMTELGAITPGLLSAETSGSFTPYIRGVGTAASTPGNESPTASYVDGLYIVDKSGLLLSGFNDVESIEILKGPQGTLFGRNATAGAISVKTRQPQQAFAAEIEATAGSDVEGMSVYLTGGLSERFSAGLSAFFENEYDYIDNLNPQNGLGDELGATRSRGARLKLLWEPTDALSLLLSADYVELQDTGNAAFATARGSGLTTAEGMAARNGLTLPDTRSGPHRYAGSVPADLTGIFSDGSGVSHTLKWDADTFGFTSITAYRESKSGRSIDADMSPLDVFFLTMQMSTRTVQQEFILSSNSSGPLSWLAGLFYIDYLDGYDNLNFVVGIRDKDPSLLQQAGQAIIDRGGEVNITSSAVYGEVGYEIDNATSVTVGLRYTDEVHELDGDNFANTLVADGQGGFIAAPTPGRLSDLCAVRPDCKDLESNFEEVTWRAVLDHRFDNGLLGYLSYNRGFKSGVYNISDTVTYDATEPEIVDAYEIGLKGRIFDDRFSFSSALFYNDYSEKQVLVNDNNVQRSVNAATVKISGLEFDMQWLVSQRLRLQAGFSTYFESEFDEFENCVMQFQDPAGGYVQVGGDCSGGAIPYTPDYQAYLSFNYDLNLQGGSKIEFGGTLSYTDAYLFDVEVKGANVVETPEYDARENLNLYATWFSPGDRYSVKAWVKNATDQEEVSGMLLTTFGTGSVYQRGRTFGLTIGASF